MPEANTLTVSTMALAAQQEREAISRRTWEALAAAKARDVKLGNPIGTAALRRAGKGGAALVSRVAADADTFTAALVPVFADIRAGGETSLRTIADQLITRGIPEPVAAGSGMSPLSEAPSSQDPPIQRRDSATPGFGY